jgi:hypothetical protein
MLRYLLLPLCLMMMCSAAPLAVAAPPERVGEAASQQRLVVFEFFGSA